MDKQQAQVIVDGLRAAQTSGGPVVELQGADARNFAFVKDTSTLLGSFSMMGGAFFVLVAATYGGTVDFQLRAYKSRAKVVLTTNKADEHGIIWDYSASKQDGNNAARKQAFRKAAGADSIVIPYPTQDSSAFISAVTRAIELRELAHAAGDDDEGSETGEGTSGDPPSTGGLIAQLFPVETERKAAARLLAATIRKAHEVNPKSWCVTNPGGEDRIRVNVGVVRVLDLVPGLVMLAVDGSKLDEAARASLGDALDLSDDERLAQFGDNGMATVPAQSFDSIPESVRAAHQALVERAASSTSPYARYHRPEVIEEIEALLDESLPVPAAPTVHYWKIAPGEDAEQWETWRDGGFIAIGWNKLGDLTNVTHDEFKKLAAEKEASGQVWKFRNIEVGDRVVANDGYFRVLGIGTVTGTYRYVAGAQHAHQIPVHWDDTQVRSVQMRGWRSTLIRLDQQTFKQIEAAPTSDGTSAIPVPAAVPAAELETELGPEGGIDFDGILASLASKQLSFSAELVASYLLALQAKRFVLLSGISGTGKTRLALEIARMLGPSEDAAPQPSATSVGEIEVVAKPYQIKYGRLVVSSELAQEFDALTDVDVKRIDLKLPGLRPQSMALYKNASRGNLFYVTLSGDAKEWFLSHIKLGDRFLLSRQTNKDSEWLELKLPTAAQRTQAAAERRYELIAVRPDWTDARALLGFYNPLTRSYITTPTLKLLLRAHADLQASGNRADPRPYFLLFDEMNLARVEHYFSDFLSAMESGEEIHLHDDPQLEDEEDIPRRIRIPKNVFVVGTVNVDETTYMFSPKVLDRAFVLEFNDVDLDGLAGPVQSEESESTPLALGNLEGGLKLRGEGSGDEWKRFEQLLGGEARALFGRIHEALMVENRHFGYRVAREVARFVDLAVKQAGPSDATVRAALDVAVLAKILPKLHGSQSEIEATLKRLLAIATADKPEAEVFTKHGAVVDGVEIPLRRTARKLWRMLRRLAANGFVSFIE